MKRNAQMFSMIAVLMSALFILLFSGATHVALDKNVPITKNEVLQTDGFIADLEYFIDTTIDRVSFDTLAFTVSYLNTTSFYPNYTTVFLSCFQQGYFYDGGVLQNCSWTNENISFTKRIAPILSNASDIYNVTLQHGLPKVTFRQYDAYAIEVNVSIPFSVDRLGMQWNVSLQESRIVDFTGITDPATIGTSYKRKIHYAPHGGDLFRAGTIGGNISLIQEFITKGYYYRDFTGLSFLDILEGRNLTNTSGYSLFGINAFVPPFNATGTSLYKNNQTTMTLYQYTSKLTFTNPSFLVRFNQSTGINSSLIFNKYYVLNNLQVSDTSQLLAVADCCDASGCNPNCG